MPDSNSTAFSRRLFLQRGIASRLREALIGAYKQVNIGDPLDPATLMGPLIDEGAVENMMRGLRTIREQGGEVIYGGNRLSGGLVQLSQVLVGFDLLWMSGLSSSRSPGSVNRRMYES